VKAYRITEKGCAVACKNTLRAVALYQLGKYATSFTFEQGCEILGMIHLGSGTPSSFMYAFIRKGYIA